MKFVQRHSERGLVPTEELRLEGEDAGIKCEIKSLKCCKTPRQECGDWGPGIPLKMRSADIRLREDAVVTLFFGGDEKGLYPHGGDVRRV